jgi:DNA-directed RNA polymerase subunit H
MAKKKRSKLVHDLIPEHTKLSEEEKEELMNEYDITLRELPKIRVDDPAIRHLDPEPNDVIRIDRNSHTAGETVFYRGVVNE